MSGRPGQDQPPAARNGGIAGQVAAPSYQCTTWTPSSSHQPYITPRNARWQNTSVIVQSAGMLKHFCHPENYGIGQEGYACECVAC
jgi:hypothetical protein